MSRNQKNWFTEAEAALEIGVSVERLREIVREQLLKDPEAPPVAEFRRADLVLLRILASGARIEDKS